MSIPLFHSLKVKEVKKETNDCVSVVFEVPKDINELFIFRPGQYLTLKQFINNEEVRRSYSICSAPQDQEIRIAIKHVDSGKFSSYINQQLKPGDLLEVMPPLGKFTPRENVGNTRSNYLAFAAGSGITPIMGIMKTVLNAHPENTFTLVYGNKSRSSIIFKEAIEALKNKYMERLIIYHVFTREKADTALFNGRINAEKANEFAKKLIDLNKIDVIFICGPEEMIHSLRGYFIDDKKIDTDKVHFELFSSTDQPKIESQECIQKEKEIDRGKVSEVTVRLDGAAYDMKLAYGGESILDTALSEGLDLPYACKGGVCSTCRAKLVEGEVDMEINYALEPDEIENNFILTCQSHPRSERVIVDFDIK